MFCVFFVLAFGLFIASCLGASLPANQNDCVTEAELSKAIQDLKYGEIRDLQSKYRYLTNRMNGARVNCFNRATNWDIYSNAPIMYLDRQNVDCPYPYFLARFRLGREGDYKSAKVRYNYRCCKFTL